MKKILIYYLILTIIGLIMFLLGLTDLTPSKYGAYSPTMIIAMILMTYSYTLFRIEDLRINIDEMKKV